ncbi:MAG: hypothetical protein ACP5I8_11045, partial [Phycisphaerae bacterium]
MLIPRTHVTRFEHHQSFCPRCRRAVHQAAPGEMPGCQIGPALWPRICVTTSRFHIARHARQWDSSVDRRGAPFDHPNAPRRSGPSIPAPRNNKPPSPVHARRDERSATLP